MSAYAADVTARLAALDPDIRPAVLYLLTWEHPELVAAAIDTMEAAVAAQGGTATAAQGGTATAARVLAAGG